jgi:hypothetical protein
MERHGVSGWVVAGVVFVVAVAALAEVGAGRSVTTAPTSRADWPALLQVGDEARSRGDAPAARQAYLGALFRARGERSMIGVLRAAEGFRALGDRDVVEQALRIAAALGPDDGRDLAVRVQALRDRLDAADALPIGVHTPR